jgi:hypothetical protein
VTAGPSLPDTTRKGPSKADPDHSGPRAQPSPAPGPGQRVDPLNDQRFPRPAGALAEAVMPRPRKQHHASFGSLTRLPSGRYRARYTGPDGLRRSAPVTFATKTAAEDWLVRTRADMSRDQWTAPERGLVTLAEYLADWLDSRVDLRPTTLALYRQLSRRWLLTAHGGVDLGRLAVGAITPELVRRWYAGLVADTHTAAVPQAPSAVNLATAARDRAHAVGMSVAATGRLPAAVRTAWDEAGRPGADPIRPPGRQAGRTIAAQTYRLLRAVLNTAVCDGIVDTNPCHIAKGGHVRADERRPRCRRSRLPPAPFGSTAPVRLSEFLGPGRLRGTDNLGARVVRPYPDRGGNEPTSGPSATTAWTCSRRGPIALTERVRRRRHRLPSRPRFRCSSGCSLPSCRSRPNWSGPCGSRA